MHFESFVLVATKFEADGIQIHFAQNELVH